MKIFIRFLIIIAVLSLLVFSLYKDKSSNIIATNQKQHIDSMIYDSFKINGVLPLLSIETDFEKLFGKPLKVEKTNLNEDCVSFFNEPDRFIEFQGSKCEGYKDSVALIKLNFHNDVNYFLNYGSMRFSSETTLEDFKKIYPSNQPYEIADNKMVVAFSTCNVCDDKFHFIFENGKLIEFEYWMPC